MDKQIDHYRKSGEILWFEYHCNESHNSQDAQLWYRSHQQVEVINCDNENEFGQFDFIERQECGMPLVYQIKFNDNTLGHAFEDELLDDINDYCRNDPPKVQ